MRRERRRAALRWELLRIGPLLCGAGVVGGLAVWGPVAEGNTHEAAVAVSAFVSDNPGTCHAWPSGTGLDVLVTVRCLGPAPYSISLARALASGGQAGGTAGAALAAAPGEEGAGAAPGIGDQRRISMVACDAPSAGCFEAAANERAGDEGVIQVVVLY